MGCRSSRGEGTHAWMNSHHRAAAGVTTAMKACDKYLLATFFGVLVFTTTVIVEPSASAPPRQPEIWVVDVETGAERQLTGRGRFGPDMESAWSPDGESAALWDAGDIWVIAADGSFRRNLTNTPESEFGQAWSPDGAWVSYFRNENNENVLWISNVEGTERRRLTPRGLSPLNPAQWSPTGGALVFHAYSPDPARDGLFLASIDGVITKIEVGPPSMVPPSWSPDGSMLATLRGGGGQPLSLFIVSADGSSERLVTSTPAGYSSPQLSPDGSKILFSAWAGGLRVVSVDGTGEREISTRSTQADWAPDSARLAVSEGSSIYELNIDDHTRRELLGDGYGAQWSPDGRHVAFSSGGDVWIVSVESGDARSIAATSQLEDGPAWSPDGHRLLFLRGGDQGVLHSRVLTLTLHRHLIAKGSLMMMDGYAPSCVGGQLLQVYRRIPEGWWHVGTLDTVTDENGSYRIRLPDIREAFKIVAPQVTPAPSELCAEATSTVGRHRH